MITAVRVLVADEYLTFPPTDGGSRTLADLIRSLEELGAHVDVARSLDEVQQLVADRVRWSVAFLSRPELTLRCAGVVAAVADRLVYVGHDLHHRRLSAPGAAPNAGPVLARAYESLERQCWQRCDVSIYPDPEEAAVAAELVGPERARWFPYFRVDRVAEPAVRTGEELVFVGGVGHGPNTDGLRWYTNDVLPLLDDPPPLDVVGHWPDDARPTGSARHLRFVGVVDATELERRLSSCAGVVVPLRAGAGVKSKVIDALAAAAPLVTTRVGMQGLAPSAPIAWVSDDPRDWVELLRRVASADDDVVARARRGTRYVEERYGTSAYLAALAKIVPDLTTS